MPTNFKTYQDFNYDDWGNIKFKTGVGNYTYYATKPHQLNEVKSASGAQLYKFFYDANGNSKTDGTRTFTYGSYDKPTLITKAGSSSTMKYGSERELVSKSDSYVENGKNVTYQTTYLGNYEKVYRTGGAGTLTEHKFYVGDIVYTQRSNGSTDTFYLHKDHQGSVIATTNGSGAVVSQAIYDPWGKRTAVYLHSSLASFTTSEPTDRGYTGHKHIKDLDIIHMGGRIYDSTLGRFLQADPNIQAPLNSQSYNRYAYVLNNPMSMTDPSGYFFKSLFGFVKKHWKTIVQIGITVMTAGAGLAWAIAGGALSGYVATGSLKGALVGAFSGAIFFGAGDIIANNGISNILAKGAIRGIAGGISSVLSGGKFGHGFAAAGVTSMAGGKIDAVFKNTVARVVSAAIVGGTVSQLTGGKFANGAMTAAFMKAYNDANHPSQSESPSDPYAPLAKWFRDIADGATAFRGSIENSLSEIRTSLSTSADAVASYMKNDMSAGTTFKGSFGKGFSANSSFKLNGDTSVSIADETGLMLKGGGFGSAPLYQQGNINGMYQQFEACFQVCINTQWDYQGNWNVNAQAVYPLAVGAALSTGYTTSGQNVANYLMNGG